MDFPLARWPLQPYDQAMDNSRAISPFPTASSQPRRLTARGHADNGVSLPEVGGDHFVPEPRPSATEYHSVRRGDIERTPK